MQSSKGLVAAGLRRSFAAIAITAAAGILVASHSLAQAPSKSEPKGKGAPKGDPKQKGPPSPQPQQGEQAPQLTYTAWVKLCQKPPDANIKRVCFTGRDGRVESGMPVVAAVVIEGEGEPKKILRVTLPLGMALQPGTRVIVDQGQPMTGPYVVCLQTGCMADYEASGELIGKLKTGQTLFVQGVNGNGQPISLGVPLAEFAKAYDGPGTDPAATPSAPPKPQ